MRVVWCAHLYPPLGAAGAEWTAHEFLLDCARRGHTVSVYDPKQRRPYEFEGVPVTSQSPRGRVDVVIGHLTAAKTFAALTRRTRAARVWMLHGSGQDRTPADTYLANSLRVQRSCRGSWLLRPHVPAYRYEQGRRGDAVTLVNVSKWKGADMLDALVAALPDVQFLGVRGAWDAQQWEAGRYRNLTIWDTQVDIRVVLAATRVMLCPSRDESWGRVPVEAGHRGIPTIAAPTYGFLESMSESVLYHGVTDVEGWTRELSRLLESPAWYAQWSRQAQLRAAVLERVTGEDAARVISRLEEEYG